MILLKYVYCFGIVASVKSVFPQFNDQLLYGITWNDHISDLKEEKTLQEKVIITTKENEKYQCLLPVVSETGKVTGNILDGPSPEVLISDLLMGHAQKCSYRLEPYWTYELCHGEKIMQFHEEKDEDGNVKRSEFILGRMTKTEVTELLSTATPVNAPGKERKVPIKNIDNKDTPYYSVEMDNGTPCDLTSGKARKTTIIYICHPTSNNEIMSVKEVTTCEYESIVLTPVLCGNPAYILKDKPVQDIQCHAFPGSPSRPLRLIEQSQEARISNVFMRAENINKVKPVERTNIKPPIDKAINTKFLKGDYCLVGGTGWWQYEFCNGKHISQFHVDPSQPKIVITVGRWNKEEHIKHLSSTKLKARTKRHVTHFYSGGDICDLTGKPRTAQVMLICKEGSGQQLSIYMTEKKPCTYTVGVESPILCPLIAKADEFGLFEMLI